MPIMCIAVSLCQCLSLDFCQCHCSVLLCLPLCVVRRGVCAGVFVCEVCVESECGACVC